MAKLRPDTKVFVDQVRTYMPNLDFTRLTPDEATQYLATMRRSGPPTRDIALPIVEDIDIPGDIRIRKYATTSDGTAPLLVYFHGGGWVHGDLDGYDHVCRHLAAHGKFMVLSVEYRLAPEHPFPAAFDDALAAARWASSHAAELGADPTRIAISGGSAGGNLAAAVALAAREAGEPRFAAQLLIYPVLDSTTSTGSYREDDENCVLSADQLRWYWAQYVPDPAGRTNPLASPRHSESVDGLPPTIVIAAEFDQLRDEGLAYADRLRDADVPVVKLLYPGQIHGFVNAIGVIGDATVALDLAAELVDQAFTRPVEQLRETWRERFSEQEV